MLSCDFMSQGDSAAFEDVWDQWFWMCPAMSSMDPPAAFFPNVLEGRETIQKSQDKLGQLSQLASWKQERSSPLRARQAEAQELSREPLEGVVDVLVALRCLLPL